MDTLRFMRNRPHNSCSTPRWQVMLVSVLRTVIVCRVVSGGTFPVRAAARVRSQPASTGCSGWTATAGWMPSKASRTARCRSQLRYDRMGFGELHNKPAHNAGDCRCSYAAALICTIQNRSFCCVWPALTLCRCRLSSPQPSCLQVRQAPGTALTVPIVVYATWRGTALGVHDAFARSGVNGHGGTSVVLVFDSAVRLFWAVFMCLAAFVLCAQLMRAALVRA